MSRGRDARERQLLHKLNGLGEGDLRALERAAAILRALEAGDAG